MSRILELFGHSTAGDYDWLTIVREQQCPYSGRKCFKIRKSESTVSIGTCVVAQGREVKPLIICPNKFLADNGRVFTDVIHLMELHEDGNEIHLLREQAIPGGSVDYFLVSAKAGKAVDFIGIEFQGLDTTGTVWPHRQAFLASKGINVPEYEDKSFGVNWKMTAKTILVQLNHKISTFEGMGKKFVLVLQDDLLDYMKSEFAFGSFAGSRSEDSMHFHAYRVTAENALVNIELVDKLSTDARGVEKAMSLGKSGNLVLQDVLDKLTTRVDVANLFGP